MFFSGNESSEGETGSFAEDGLLCLQEELYGITINWFVGTTLAPEADANVLLEGFLAKKRTLDLDYIKRRYNGELQHGKRKNGLLLLG